MDCPKHNQLNTFTNFEVNFPLRESFQSELRKNYGSEIAIVPVDFTNRPRTTLRRMNGFIAKNTNNLIRDMFKQPVSPDNKVEAKGFWLRKESKYNVCPSSSSLSFWLDM